jgi:hypothetical protein
MFIDGYLGLLTAISGTTVTECSQAGYARQPIAFGDPVDGIAFSAIPFTFGMGLKGTGAVGRGIYDAPTGGNLLLILPYPTPLASGRLPWDAGEAGHLRLFFTALASTHRGGAFTGRIAAAAMAGLCSDAYDVVNPVDVSGRTPGLQPGQFDPLTANPRPLINTATMTAGVALSVARGVLQASALVPAGSE